MHNDKLEGKRKVQAILGAFGLALVLFCNTYYQQHRENPPRSISDVRVGENFNWQETVMACNFVVLNIQSVVPPTPDDHHVIETDKVCGKLQCRTNSLAVEPAVHGEDYTCYKLSDIKSRL